MSRLFLGKSNFNSSIILLFFLLTASPNLVAGTINIGLGVGFADGANFSGFEVGGDYQVGYEFDRSGRAGEDFNETKNWHYGAQLQILDGSAEPSDIMPGDLLMAFDALALYATARPPDWPLLLKAGVVHANYTTGVKTVSATGIVFGFGLDLKFGDIRLNAINYRRYYIGPDVINVFSLSIFILLN